MVRTGRRISPVCASLRRVATNEGSRGFQPTAGDRRRHGRRVATIEKSGVVTRRTPRRTTENGSCSSAGPCWPSFSLCPLIDSWLPRKHIPGQTKGGKKSPHAAPQRQSDRPIERIDEAVAMHCGVMPLNFTQHRGTGNRPHESPARWAATECTAGRRATAPGGESRAMRRPRPTRAESRKGESAWNRNRQTQSRTSWGET